MSTPLGTSYIHKLLGAIGLLLLCVSVLLIPAVQVAICTQGDEDTWRASLWVLLPLSLLFLCLAFIGTLKPAGIRWLSLPLFGLVPWAGVVAARFTYGVTFLGSHLCAVSTGELGFNSYPSSWWSVIWGPAQLVFLALIVWCIYKYWVPSIVANKALESQAAPAGTPHGGAP